MSSSFLAWRIVHTGIVVLAILTLVFFAVRLMPGDPVMLLVPPDASPATVEELRRELGYDRPLVVQYANYMGEVASGNLGTSIRQHRPVTEMVFERLPATIELAIGSMLLACLTAIPLGVLAANRRGSVIDTVARLIATLSQAVPTFWLGIILIILVSVRWGWLPTSGRGSLEQMILPCVTLGFYMFGPILRLTRVSMVDTLSADYVRTAYAKGLRPSMVLFRHGFRNALIPIVTLVGLQTGKLLGGAVITESVFAWPGIGSLAINAVYQRDYPVVQGVVVLAAITFVLVNMVIDVCYLLINPVIRFDK
ncbi:MAG: ABC transporter permease [Thermomicrobiales bacterium]|nr:ABC transporter permease [Thermomicrobiales bacterium]